MEIILRVPSTLNSMNWPVYFLAWLGLKAGSMQSTGNLSHEIGTVHGTEIIPHHYTNHPSASDMYVCLVTSV